MANLGLKEMGKFVWESRKKGLPCWLSQFSKTKQPTGQIFSLPSQTNFPISFKPKVAIAKFIGKMQKKRSGIMESGMDAMPHFLIFSGVAESKVCSSTIVCTSQAA